MSTFTERIRLVFDVDSKGAQTGMAGFRKSVAEAEGFTGKFRAGLGSLKASFSQFITSGTGAATVATAVGAGLFKAVEAAQDLALETGRLADATGLSTEQASRWLEVAKDVGVESEQIAGLIQKLTKNLGASGDKFAAYGVTVQHAADGSVDMNATLLQAIDVLNGVEDPTKRAALAQKLFGKSWAEASELITMGAANLKARLAEVSDAKVVTEEQRQQAREFRDAMDKLADVGEDFMLIVGKELVPVLADLAGALGTVGDVAGSVDDALQTLTFGLVDLKDVAYTVLTGGLYPLYKGLEKLADFTTGGEPFLDGAINQLERVKTVTEFVVAALDEVPTAADAVAEAEARVARQAEIAASSHRTLAEKIREAGREWDVLTGKMDDENAFANAVLSVSALQEQIDAINADTDLTAAEKFAKITLAVNGTKATLHDTLAEWNMLSPALEAGIQAKIDSGDIDGAIAKLQLLAAIAARLNMPGATWFGSNVGRSSTTPGIQARATGGPAGGVTLVGEQGPELVDLPGGSFVHNAGATKGLLGGGGGTNVNITVNVPPSANPAEVGRATADALAAFYRQGGQRP